MSFEASLCCSKGAPKVKNRASLWDKTQALGHSADFPNRDFEDLCAVPAQMNVRSAIFRILGYLVSVLTRRPREARFVPMFFHEAILYAKYMRNGSKCTPWWVLWDLCLAIPLSLNRRIIVAIFRASIT